MTVHLLHVRLQNLTWCGRSTHACAASPWETVTVREHETVELSTVDADCEACLVAALEDAKMEVQLLEMALRRTQRVKARAGESLLDR